MDEHCVALRSRECSDLRIPSLRLCELRVSAFNSATTISTQRRGVHRDAEKSRTTMKVISLNVGLPKLVLRGEEPVSTGIFKEPSPERRVLRTLNLDGDRQADLSVHGGVFKAAYAYPSEHYEGA